MSDDAYDKFRRAGVPEEYLNDRYRVSYLRDTPDGALIWVYRLEDNECVWRSPATIAYPDAAPDLWTRPGTEAGVVPPVDLETIEDVEDE